MRQYVTVELVKDGLQAKVIQVESGLFGDTSHVEDMIIGPRRLVKIYIQSNYPELNVETGEELLEE